MKAGMTKAMLVSFVLLSINSFAQKSRVLTFEEAVKIGLEKNVTLNTEKNQLFASQARRLAGFAGYLPSINAQAFAQRQDGLQIDPTTGEGSNVTADYIQGQVSANYLLFNGFNRISTLKQFNKQFYAQTSFVEKSKQDVIFNVTSQYLQVLLDQELLKIAKENYETQNVIFEQIKGFVQLGSRAEADQFSQDALLQNFKVIYLRAKMTLMNDQALLAQTLQLDPVDSFNLAKPEWINDVNYFKDLSLDSLYQIAEKSRPDLLQQQYLLEAAKYGIKAGTSGYYPTLSLFANYGSTYFASDAYKLNNNTPPPASFKEQFGRANPSLSYGISLNIPIFDRLQTRTNRVIAKVAHQNAELTYENLVKTIKIDVQQAYNNFKVAIESYNASLVQYQAGELSYKTQQESFALGVSSQVELAQANQVFVQAASSKAQAEVTLIFQQMLLEYALGTLKFQGIAD